VLSLLAGRVERLGAVVLAHPPTSIELVLSDAVRADSVSASDLTLDQGAVATDVEIVDGRTLRFTIDAPDVANIYTYGLAAGAFLDLQGEASGSFQATFVVDQTGPRVIASEPSQQAAAPFTTWSFVLDEAVDAAALQLSDVVSFTGPSGTSLLGLLQDISAVDDVVTVTFFSQLTAGSYAMTLGPTLRDVAGNLLDQNQDGTGGQPDDTFTASLILQSPNLVVDEVSIPLAGELGGPLAVSWTVRNAGTDPALEDWFDSVWLSRDANLSQDDVLLTYPTAANESPLAVQGAYDRTVTVSLPISPSYIDGTYYILVRTDYAQKQPESNENDNVRAALFPEGISGDYFVFVYTDVAEQVFEGAYEANNTNFDQTPVHVFLTPPPDLVVQSLEAPTAALASHALTFQYRVGNEGTTAPPDGWWRDAYYLSADPVLNTNTDILLETRQEVRYLPPAESYEQEVTLTLPDLLDGSYYLIVQTDSNDQVFELENINFRASTTPIDIESRPADLIVTAVDVPLTASVGSAVHVNWTVLNQDTGDTAVSLWTDRIVLPLAGGLTAVQTDDVGGIVDPLGQYSASALLEIPSSALPGHYFLRVETDIANAVLETYDNNNTSVLVPIEITAPPVPDFVVDTVNADANALSGGTLAVNWSIHNDGGPIAPTAARQDVVSLVEEGTGRTIDLGAVLVSASDLSVSESFAIPFDLAGRFRVHVFANGYDSVREERRDNNELQTATPTEITLAPVGDLVVAFDEPIDPLSFTTGQVTLTGPAGLIDIENISPVNDRTFEISFAEQLAYLDYTVTIGPDVRDLVGNAMNQDGDLLNGQATDAYVGAFHILPGTQPSDTGLRTSACLSLYAPAIVWCSPGTADVFWACTQCSDRYGTAACPRAQFACWRASHHDRCRCRRPKVRIIAVDQVLCGVDSTAFRRAPASTGTITALRDIYAYERDPAAVFIDHGVPVPWFEDQYEPNDETGGAHDLGIYTEPLRLDGLVMQEEGLREGDYFKIRLPKTSFSWSGGIETYRLEVKLDFAQQYGDLDIRVEDVTGITQTRARRKGSSEVIIVPDLTTEKDYTFFIAIAGHGRLPDLVAATGGGDFHPDYKLSIEVHKDLQHEPTGDPTPINLLRPKDPNEIVGPMGYGPDHWISADEPLPFEIHFENAADATAPAQVVTITQALDDDLDETTFRLGDFGWGPWQFDVPENRAFYSERVDLRDHGGFFVDVAAGIDVAARQAFWSLITIDPATGDVPADPLSGFLPINNAMAAGQGFVSYEINSKESVLTGTVIDSEARIIFDIEEPIGTPAILHTLDVDGPSSHVLALPAQSEETSFLVNLSNVALPNGCSFRSRAHCYEEGSSRGACDWVANLARQSG
jgi:hypothetical protein